MENGIKFSINIDRLFRYHLIGIGLLALAYILIVASAWLFGFDTMKGLTHLFSLEGEGNLPTLFSAAALTLLAAACLLCAKNSPKGECIFWKVLAAAFLFLAVDEGVSFHEYLSLLVQKSLNASGAFGRAWVIPYGIAAAIFAVLTLPKLLRLPPRTRNGLVIAGALYVAGAIGFEMLESFMVARVFAPSMAISLFYSFCVLWEEALEMLGVALALRTCLLHVMGRARFLNLTVAAGAH
jgi:hypothetical protein